MIDAAKASLDLLLEGNRRFREGRSTGYSYDHDEIADLAVNQRPHAAIVACSDSRVAPETIFNQPLGAIFASRVPGNVASDSAKWMLEIAVQNLHVPLVLVVGHTGCLAVGQLLDGDQGGPGGALRSEVAQAVFDARGRNPQDLFLEAVKINAQQTVKRLVIGSPAVRLALEQRKMDILPAVYFMETGEVKLLDPIQL